MLPHKPSSNKKEISKEQTPNNEGLMENFKKERNILGLDFNQRRSKKFNILDNTDLEESVKRSNSKQIGNTSNKFDNLPKVDKENKMDKLDFEMELMMQQNDKDKLVCKQNNLERFKDIKVIKAEGLIKEAEIEEKKVNANTLMKKAEIEDKKEKTKTLIKVVELEKDIENENIECEIKNKDRQINLLKNTQKKSK